MTVARDVLTRLLAATPSPPETLEIDELLVAFEAIAGARQELLAQLPGTLAPTPEERALAREISARQDEWRDALATARARLCEQRLGVGKLRSYATTDAAGLTGAAGERG